MEDNIAELGQLARVGHDFCPYSAVAKFPYKYIDKANLQPVSETHFAGGQFRARGWTLYYIYPHTGSSSPKPLILVPAIEVEALIHDINKDFGSRYTIPSSNREPGFLLNFDEKGSPRPRYLGRVNADISVEDLESKIPPLSFKARGETEMPEDRSFAAFKAKMEAAVQATKNKTKSQKERKKKERVNQKQAWCAQLQRAQCYLGVRPRRGFVPKKDPLATAVGWAELQEAQKAYDLARSANLPELDTSKLIPYLFDQNVVFVCIDIEAWEKDHSVITEIGVSTLDTNDLAALPPGEGAKNWKTAIRPRHFRITEYQHLINQDFIVGCADRFEKEFGTSSFISISEAPQVIASCFREPFSAGYQMKSHNGPEHIESSTSALHQADSNSKRNIILVGHDIQSDINYMRSIGYDVSNLPNLLEAIDTADMFKALKHEGQSRSLGGVLLELEMVGWNLHNAGNDAAYTLQAMIGIAFAGLQDKQKREAIAQAERARRMENAAQDAQDRILEESEEWETADMEGDGGIPVAVSKYGEDQRNNAKKGAPRSNHAARSSLQRTEAKRSETRHGASASTNDSEARDPKGSRGLIVHNLKTQEEVLNLFYGEDERKIVKIQRHGKHTGQAIFSVHFSTHDEAKAALDRQPAEHKKRTFADAPGQPPKPQIKWFDEDRSAVPRNGTGAGKENPNAYKPVTEWGPSAKVSPQGQANKGPKSPVKPKEPSARMRARMALLDLGGDGEK